jgi:hypothetical protein
LAIVEAGLIEAWGNLWRNLFGFEEKTVGGNVE